jgi:hypothetical protein
MNLRDYNANHQQSKKYTSIQSILVYYKTTLGLYRTINSARHLLSPLIANTPAMREVCFAIRYGVFAEELNLEPLNDCNLEFNNIIQRIV